MLIPLKECSACEAWTIQLLRDTSSPNSTVTLFALAEIIRRYIFGVVFEWGQDAVIYMMVSSVAFYICVTQVNRNHLVMSAVLQLLNAKGLHKPLYCVKIRLVNTIDNSIY